MWEDTILNANHTLIAGCSGSGKSVALNAILYRALSRGEFCMFVMIDLKRVELCEFRNLPHTLAYADTVATAKDALKGTVSLIEARYARMQQNHEKKSSEPPVYVLIDEYADLVLMDKTVNPLVQRISQIGRASNVHLILCTQRPTSSDKVLTGAIKCNLETRLALRCMTAQDSRNVINVKGAEQLPRYGYGILQDCGYNETVKINMVTDEEWKELFDLIGGLQCQTQEKKPQKDTKPKKCNIFSSISKRICTQMS